jgi:hypothetical protein
MTFADITNQKQAYTDLQRVEEQVRQSDESMARVLSSCSIPMACWRVDSELRHTWVGNPFAGIAATTMEGARNDELSMGAGGQQLLDLQRRVLSTGEGEEQDITLEINSESQVWRVCARPLHDAEDRRVGVSAIALALSQITQARGQARGQSPSE